MILCIAKFSALTILCHKQDNHSDNPFFMAIIFVQCDISILVGIYQDADLRVVASVKSL